MQLSISSVNPRELKRKDDTMFNTPHTAAKRDLFEMEQKDEVVPAGQTVFDENF